MNNDKIMLTYETHVNEDTSNTIKYIQHDFKDGAKVMITKKHKYFKRSYEWNSCYSNIYYIY